MPLMVRTASYLQQCSIYAMETAGLMAVCGPFLFCLTGRWKPCIDLSPICQNGWTFADDDWVDGDAPIGNKFYNVFLHELGHAQAKLSDEYSYGYDP